MDFITELNDTTVILLPAMSGTRMSLHESNAFSCTDGANLTSFCIFHVSSHIKG